MAEQPKALRYSCRVAWTGVLAVIANIACAADVPQTMDAIVQRGFGGPEVLKLEQVPTPRPGADQVLVHIYAVGINPIEWRTRMGIHRHDQGPPAGGTGSAGGSVPAAPNLNPGDEIAGVIAAVGSAVSRWHVGDAVFGRAAHKGAYAQYAVANGDGIASKPKRLTFAQAAGLPAAGITGLLAVKQTGVVRGQTLVIVGAAGGVGSAALQIAKARGVRVIAIASSRHDAYLKRLGADEIVDYDKGNPGDRVSNADAVINLVDGPAADVLAYVRRGGAIVLPAGVIPRAQCAAAGVICNGMDQSKAPSTAESLEEISRLVDAGHFTVKIEKAFPLAQAGQAQELDRAGHAEGKIVLVTTAAADQR